jgi:hypothetical protein
MQFKAANDLAMILPIPTPKGVPEDAVKFINLEKYPEFFDDLATGFEAPKGRSKSADHAPKATLTLVEVGSFVASFVPTVKDFARLDAQFRLPGDVWEKLPQYKDFGFAVFKLKKPEKGEQKVHPMAFEFPREDREILFFPTVHIHDGTVPAKAEFDHTLYCQLSGDAPARWEESSSLADSFVKVKQTQGIIDGQRHVYRKIMVGKFENKDVGVSV